MKPFGKIILAVLIIAILGLVGFRIFTTLQKAKVKPVAVVQAIPVKTEAVAMRQIKDDVILTGTIAPDKVVNVASKLGGRLLTASYKEGDRVAAGQLLASVEAIENDHSVQNAQFSVSSATASYENARLNYERNQKLFEAGLISQQVLDGAKLSYDTALNAKKQAENGLSLARSQDNYANVYSPVSGVILKKFFEVGSLASGPIYSVGAIGQVKVQINADEKLLTFLKVGQPVTFTVDSWPDQTFQGKIANIQPQVDTATRTVLVEIAAANGDRKLFPGMFAKVVITRRAADNVPAAPLEALLNDAGGQYVYVVANGKAVKRAVQTGLADETQIEIVSGLQEGDQIIVAGQHTVVENSPVEVVGGTKQ